VRLHLELLWVLPAVACQWLVYGAIALILNQPLRRSGYRLSPVFLLPLGALFLFANRALPGPALAGLATLTYRLRSRNVPAEAAHATAAVFYMADYLSFTLLGAVAAVFLFLTGRLSALHPGLLALAVGIIGIGAALAFIVLRRREGAVGFARAVAGVLARLLRRKSVAWETATADRMSAFYTQWDEVTDHPGTLPAAVALALAMHLFEVGALWCCCRAFGGAVLPVYAAAGYVAGNLGAILSFLPGGAVLFEGGMIAALHGLAGMSLPTALAGTLLYRMMSVYLPLPFVLPALRQALQARG
jgi:uncharacterized protein (TIRG00374 family)